MVAPHRRATWRLARLCVLLLLAALARVAFAHPAPFSYLDLQLGAGMHDAGTHHPREHALQLGGVVERSQVAGLDVAALAAVELQVVQQLHQGFDAAVGAPLDAFSRRRIAIEDDHGGHLVAGRTQLARHLQHDPATEGVADQAARPLSGLGQQGRQIGRAHV